MTENNEVTPTPGKPVRKALKLKPLKPIEAATPPTPNTETGSVAAPATETVQKPKPMTPPPPIVLKPVMDEKTATSPEPEVVKTEEENKGISSSDPTVKAEVQEQVEEKTAAAVSEDAPATETAAPKAPVQEAALEDARKTIEAPAEKAKIGFKHDDKKTAEKKPETAEKKVAPANPRPVYNSDDDVSPVFLVSSVIALILALGLAAISFIQYSNLFNGTNIQIPGL